MYVYQTGVWKVCITNDMLVDINVVAQVESTAEKTSSSDDNQEDEEESLPITVQSSIVNKNPDFNSRSGK